MHPKLKELTASLTAEITAALTNGGKWTSGLVGTDGYKAPKNALTGNRYNGINALGLWVGQQIHGYWSNQWVTFKQKCELEKKHGKPMLIRAGETATTGMKVGDFIPSEFKPEGGAYRSSKTGELVDKSNATRKMWRPFSVFNLAQFETLPPEVGVKPELRADPPASHTAELELFIAELGVARREGYPPAYHPILDYVQVPQRALFTDDAFYAGTLAHEVIHWTGHDTRLKRGLMKINMTGDVQGYAGEELVAEIGALLLCVEFGVPPTFAHAEYAAQYLQFIKSKEDAIVNAASKADAAVRWLLEKGGRAVVHEPIRSAA